MERRRRDSFAAGVEAVWLIDLETRTASVYRRNGDAPRHYVASETVEVTEVLPGFQYLLADLFAELDDRDFVEPVLSKT
jgi:Uma2 family endonuclease